MKFFLSLLLGIVFSCTAAETNEANIITSRVVDENGTPVVGAVVGFYKHTVSNKVDLVSKTETDTNGVFFLKAGQKSGTVLIQKEPLAPYWQDVSQILGPINNAITMGVSTNVMGTVKDDNGNPMADVEVSLFIVMVERKLKQDQSTYYSSIRQEMASSLFKTRTDNKGRFEIRGLPQKSYFIFTVKKPGMILCDILRESCEPANMTASAGDKYVSLKLEPECVIEGRVEVPQAFGSATNIMVALEMPKYYMGFSPMRTHASLDGKFRFSGLLPTTYIVRAYFGTNRMPDYMASPVEVTLETSETNRDVILKPCKGGTLEVDVVSAKDGATMTKGIIRIEQKAPLFYESISTNGPTSFRLYPGKFVLRVFCENADPKTQMVTIEEGKTNHVGIKVEPLLIIKGTVLGTNGQPIAGIKVSVLSVMGGYENNGVLTDSNGMYSIKLMRMQERRQAVSSLVVRDLDMNLAVAEEITEDSSSVIDLKLQQGLTISGSVVDGKKNPLTNALPRLMFWIGNSGHSLDSSHQAQVDSQGRFKFKALPRGGKYSVFVSADGYGVVNTEASEIDGTVTEYEFPPMTLIEATQQLAGIVVDADDKPVSGAQIFTYGNNQPNIAIKTKEDGHFSVDHLCEGMVQLSVSKDNLYISAKVQAGDTNVILTLANSPMVSQSVVNKEIQLMDKPLPDITFAGVPSPTAGKRTLLVLFDFEQRPCRRALKMIDEKAEFFSSQNVTVIAINVMPSTDEFKEWKDSKPVSFPLGAIQEKNDSNKWITESRNYPYLILTDEQGKVTAAGFGVDDLDKKLGSQQQEPAK